MHLRIAQDYHEMSRLAARLVADTLRASRYSTITIPTGGTPLGFYEELGALHRARAIGSVHLHVFQLDEYLGVPPDDPHSFANWITRAFVEPLGIGAERVTWLRGDVADTDAACRAYDAELRAAGGLDIAVLGLGENGHIGFNEPPATPDATSRVVRLTDETRAANAVYWGADTKVPTHALTCGMANLLAAKMKIVLVSGERKRDILRRALYGPITADLPASLLRLVEGVTIIADREAATDVDTALLVDANSG